MKRELNGPKWKKKKTCKSKRWMMMTSVVKHSLAENIVAPREDVGKGTNRASAGGGRCQLVIRLKRWHSVSGNGAEEEWGTGMMRNGRDNSEQGEEKYLKKKMWKKITFVTCTFASSGSPYPELGQKLSIVQVENGERDNMTLLFSSFPLGVTR